VYTKITKGGVKVLGEAEFNFADYINGSKEVVLKLEKCPDKDGQIALEIKATQIVKESPLPKKAIAKEEINSSKDEEVKTKIPPKPEGKAVRSQRKVMGPSPRKEENTSQVKPSPSKHEDNKNSANKVDTAIKKESIAKVDHKVKDTLTKDKPPVVMQEKKTVKEDVKEVIKQAKKAPISKSVIVIDKKAGPSLYKSEVLDLKGMPLEVIMVTAERLDTEKNKLQRQLMQCEKDLNEQIRQNIADKEESTRKINKLNETLKKLERENSGLVDKSNLLEKSLSREMNTLTEMSQETGLLTERLTQYLKHKNEFEQQLSQISKELLSTNNKCEMLEKKKVDLEESLEETKEEVIKLKKEKQATERTLDELRKKLDDTRSV